MRPRNDSFITSSIATQDLADTNPDHLEIITEFINLFCLSVLATALGSKTISKRLRPLNYGRALVILVYFFSWAFSATAVLVISTNYKNYVSCTVGMLACDIFYAGSKIVCYLWLIERVHLVSTSTLHLRRLETWQYRFHIALLFPYIAIAALMLTYRNIIILPNGQCLIGLQLPASGPLIVYDFCFNLYLTILFVIPLIRVSRRSRAEWTRTRLYNLSIRSLIASVVCLLVSFANVCVNVITNGEERGLMCLTMCTGDVTINVIAIHYVTTSQRWGPRKPSEDDSDTASTSRGGGTGGQEPQNDTLSKAQTSRAHGLSPTPDLSTTAERSGAFRTSVNRSSTAPTETVNSYERDIAAAMFIGDVNKLNQLRGEEEHDINHDEDDFSIRSVPVSQISLQPLQERD